MAERVTVIGAGLTGLTLALLCAKEGHRVTVVDSAFAPGDPNGLMAAPATVQQELQYHHVWRWAGESAAVAYGEQVRLGQDMVVAVAQDMGVPVHRADLATVTTDGMEAFWLRYEVAAMRAAGLNPEFTDTTGLPFSTRPQLISPAQPVVDVTAYRDALARAVVGSGGELVSRMPPAPDEGWVVSTTPEPVFDGAAMRPRLRSAMWNWVEFTADPPALPTRSFSDLDDGGRVLAVTGDRAWLGSRSAPALDWVTRHVEGARVLAQWQAPAAASFDALPFVGFSGNRSERRLVACGFDCWELTLGTAAAVQLAGVISGSDVRLPWQPVRVPRAASLGRAVWGRVRHGLRINPVTPFPRRG
ncbi:FAD-dependent oxidoreductase [Granulicoccus sp. GXG6511]|uniref:FAD-dependent oxidoreductase n=1 Tax=Granulicoccus sp. GXG6511 TaxID=3381351 RepID=UPI003D7EF010